MTWVRERGNDYRPGVQESDTTARECAPVTDLVDWRPWIAAAEHLNAMGYSAAVPAGVVMPLRRRGFDVWAAGSGRVA